MRCRKPMTSHLKDLTTANPDFWKCCFCQTNRVVYPADAVGIIERTKSFNMRYPFLLCLLLRAGAVGAVTRAYEASMKAASPAPSIEKSPLTSASKADDSVGWAVDQEKQNIHTRRPYADQGIRYSSNDWLRNLITTPLSYILKRVAPHLLVNIGISLLAVHLHAKHGDSVGIPMTGHSLLGSSLGLLLSYRTNAAYGRFWEARGYWTKSKVTCRNLAILMKYHIRAHSPKATKKFLELLTAFPGALMFLCLGGAAKLPDYTQMYLPNRHLDYLEAPSLPAILLIIELEKALHEAKVQSKSSRYDFVEASHLCAASHMVESLMECMASCEKILRTPVPWTYSRHTSRFLTIWLGTLPFALIGDMKPWLVVAIVAAASYCMLGIEEIGHLIEQPFLGDPIDGEEKVYSALNDEGKPSALIKRGRLTQPYDIGIPVCSLAAQIRKDLNAIIDGKPSH
jgi:ion channel-forming bestrophin family protein